MDIIPSILSGGISGALLVWLLRAWISERLRQAIQHEYDLKLEAHKAQLNAEHEVAFLRLRSAIEREAALHAAARSSFSEGQKAAMERKLNSVDRLWRQVIHLRGSLPPIITFIDVLTVGEYKGAKDHPTFQALTGELSIEKVAGMISKEDAQIEDVRPYVGEYMWAIFFSYQAIMLRLLFLLHLGRDDAAKLEWYRDTGVRQLMEAVLTKKELDEFDAIQFGKVSWLQRRLESKILTASSKIISGEEFGEEALKQASLIQNRAEQIQAETKTAYRDDAPDRR